MQVVAVEFNREAVRDEVIMAMLPGLLPRFYNYARYLLDVEDARDAVASGLEHLWRNRAKFRESPTASLERWATRVVINKIRDEARRHRRRPAQVSLSDLDVAVGDATDWVAQLAQVQDAIHRLSQRDADLVALRFGADLSNGDIADLLGSTPGAVAVAVHRAIQRLRQHMDKEAAR